MYEVVMTLLERIRANSTVNPEEALITSRILRKMSAFGMCQPLVRAYCAEAVTDAYITLKRFAEAGIEIDVMQELLEEAREDAQEDGRRVGTDPVAIFIEKSIVGHREQLRQAEQQGDSVLPAQSGAGETVSAMQIDSAEGGSEHAYEDSPRPAGFNDELSGEEASADEASRSSDQSADDGAEVHAPDFDTGRTDHMHPGVSASPAGVLLSSALAPYVP